MGYTLEEFNTNLGKRIALYRELAGLTQSELAEKVKYKDRTSIAKIENGTVKIPMKKLSLIAEVLNTDIETLCMMEEQDELEEQVEKKLSDGDATFKKIVKLLIDLDDENLDKAYKLLDTMFGG